MTRARCICGILITIAIALTLLGGISGWIGGNAPGTVGLLLWSGVVIMAALLGATIGRGLHATSGASVQTVPEYFKSGLDALQEGILVLDYGGHIVFCNRTFLEISGGQLSDLTGQKARDLSWQWCDLESETGEGSVHPIHWLQAVKSGHNRCGYITGWAGEADRILSMSSVALTVGIDRPHGALISLMDVTKLHQKQIQISSMLATVRESSRQIREQHDNLEELILRDPLTGCFHRRYAVEFLATHWRETDREAQDLACLLVNIDHLRTINEIHGQALADQILQEVAGCLMRFVRQCDLVCRYNGDEFLILMPQTDTMEAVRRAEALRQQVARLPQADDVSLTVSIGVACRSEMAATFQDLLSRAENGLAQAKEEGRNRVCWIAPRSIPSVRPRSTGDQASEISRIIPYPAVTALISALAFRDFETASHSRRVADLCIALGQRLMSMSNCYVLEIAALLHDIGKMGVPEALLQKAIPLTDAEWKVMGTQDRVGVEIVRTAFANPELTEIVASYSRRYDESRLHHRPLSLGARILAVADAYDSMTSTHIYRAAMSSGDALAELHRCAGAQFDPEIVTQFAEIVQLQASDIVDPFTVTVDVALAIGLELEGLAEAVDQQNLNALRELAARLREITSQNGSPEISAKAAELEQAIQTGTDQVGILQCANELLNHCRATQTTYMSMHHRSQEGLPELHTFGPDASELTALLP